MGIKLVSAIVTTHNRLNLLKKAINSVLQQTYPYIEIIVVDDASSDGTKQYIEFFLNSLNNSTVKDKFKYIYINKENSRGGNYARNLGIQCAKGDYVAFLDDDDEWFDQKIQKQVDFFAHHTDIGVVSCCSVFEYNFNKRVAQDLNWIDAGDLSKNIFARIPFTTSSMMIRRSLLLDVGMFDENLRYWQEYELLIRLCQITQVGVVREHLFLFRKNINDKNRLTNNINGWEEAVQYIELKHQVLICKLEPKIKKAHKMLILQDGAVRADRCKDTTLKRKFLKKILYTEPTIKNFVKYILCKPQLRNNL